MGNFNKKMEGNYQGEWNGNAISENCNIRKNTFDELISKNGTEEEEVNLRIGQEELSKLSKHKLKKRLKKKNTK